MLPDEPRGTYRAFYNSARHNDVLEPKTTLLLHIATAMASGCYP